MSEASSKPLPACQKCQYYKVTWDKQKPHGCLFFSFKSYHVPAVEVQQSTGMHCPQFRLSAQHSTKHNTKHSGAKNFAERIDSSSESLEMDYPKPKYSKDGKLIDIFEPPKDADGDEDEKSHAQVLNPNAEQAIKNPLGEKGILL